MLLEKQTKTPNSQTANVTSVTASYIPGGSSRS